MLVIVTRVVQACLLVLEHRESFVGQAGEEIWCVDGYCLLPVGEVLPINAYDGANDLSRRLIPVSATRTAF